MKSDIDVNNVERLASRLRQAESSRTPIPSIRDEMPAGDIATAYAIQQVNTELGIAAGRRVVGRKIG